MNFFFFLFFPLLFFSSPGYSSTRTIVFLGDSLTAGYGLPEEASYPAHIQEFLKEEGFEWNVVNAGISGDTTRGGLKRLNWVLQSSPSVVFVALGANDGLRGFEISHTKNNLEEIILALKKSGIRVVLTGMQLPANYGESYRKKFKDIFPALAKKHRVPLFPFLLEDVATKPELNLSDGIHPNEKGQEMIARQLYKFLKPILIKIK